MRGWAHVLLGGILRMGIPGTPAAQGSDVNHGIRKEYICVTYKNIVFIFVKIDFNNYLLC